MTPPTFLNDITFLSFKNVNRIYAELGFSLNLIFCYQLHEDRHIKFLWILIFGAVLIWSGIHPKDQFTWFLEVSPAIFGFILMAITYNSFRLTSLLYFLILAHCIVLMIGGHYTYAEVPFFDGLFGSERNNYDKVGHVFQGFVPAIIAREILIRKAVVKSRGWLNLFVISVTLAFSAFYELYFPLPRHREKTRKEPSGGN